MKQLRILSVVCPFSLSIGQVNDEDRFLVDEGKACAEMIISEAPARSTRLAAAELQTYVAKISGARVPIRAEPSADVPVQIYTGESRHAASRLMVSNTALTASLPVRSGSRGLATTRISRRRSRGRRTTPDAEQNCNPCKEVSGLPCGVPNGRLYKYRGWPRAGQWGRRSRPRFSIQIGHFEWPRP